MTVKIDHATLAAPTLAQMEQAFTALGLKPDYGGTHSNGVTHMSLLGFEDGTYLELISTIGPGHKPTVWDQAIAAGSGPCAWALAVEDVGAEAKRIAAAGIRVIGPHPMNRQRPDGLLVQWELAYLGEGDPGSTLPFLIQDFTPRSRRVQPTQGLADKGLTGVATVVLGVRKLDEGIDLFRRAFGWPAPSRQEDTALGASLAHFDNTPVVLAMPLGTTGWLAERLRHFGDTPCAYLLNTPDLAVATRTFGLANESNWFGQRLAWFDPEKLNGAMMGCIQQDVKATA